MQIEKARLEKNLVCIDKQYKSNRNERKKNQQYITISSVFNNKII